MARRALVALGVLLSLAGASAPADEAAPKPPAARVDEPDVLRVEGGGPTAKVNALAFGPDNLTLYAAGFDKVVRVWKRARQGSEFKLQPTAYRVPIGPGTGGVINCLAVSPDGKWLAAAGLGAYRGQATFHGSDDRRVRVLTPDNLPGLVYLFPIRDPGNAEGLAVRVLRGHDSAVVALHFAPQEGGEEPVLVSAGYDVDSPRGRQLMVWDVKKAAYWDAKGNWVDGGARVAEWTLPPAQAGANPQIAPALAVRRTGKGTTDLRVAVAWSDDKLRTWDVAAGGDERFQETADGKLGLNNTAAYVSESTLVTGGYDQKRKSGYLRLWDDAPVASPAAREPRLLQVKGYDYLMPRALAVLSGGRAPARYAVAALLIKKKGEDQKYYNLCLLSLADGDLKGQVALWYEDPTTPTDPVLTASDDGRYVAVAGSESLGIRLYATESLLAGQDIPQLLSSAGSTVRSVAFVRRPRTEDLGLLLGASAPVKDMLVFDLTHGRLSRDTAKQGWKVADPAGDDCKLDFDPDHPGRGFAWSGPQGAKGRVVVPLEEGEQVTASALLPPPGGAAKVPLLAVATLQTKRNQPLLYLYEANTGKQLRQLMGHARTVRSLAFAPDGKSLASAADDQTVCLWSLTGLEQVIDQHAELTGVLLRQRGADVIVERIEPGSPATDKLVSGDIIKTLRFKKDQPEPRTGFTALEFCDAVWAIKPGSTVWLEVKRQGVAGLLRVPVETGQGVEARNPLFSLFITDDGKADPEWVAWSPQGPYDAHGATIDEYVGWHFNPAKVGEPVKFAELKAYREKYRKPGLVGSLLTTGLPPLPNRPRPQVRVESVNGQYQGDTDRLCLVHRLQVEVRLAVEDISLEDVESVVAAVGDEEPQPLDLKNASGQHLSGTVTLKNIRQEYPIRIALQPKDDRPPATAQVRVRCHPLPPKVVFLTKDEKPLDVSKPVPADDTAFSLRARVTADEGQGTSIWLRVNDRPARELTPQGTIVKEDLKLDDGENTIHIDAENQGAVDPWKAAETGKGTLVVLVQEKTVPQPRFTKVVPGPESDHPEEREVTQGQALVVDRPAGRLLGVVPSWDNSIQVTIETPDGKVLPLKPGPKTGGTSYDYTRLQPGRQTFILKADRNGKVGTATLVLDYQPALPKFTLTDPRAGQKIREDGANPRPSEVPLKGVFTPPPEPYPFTLVIQVFDKEDNLVLQRGEKQLTKSFDKVPGSGPEPVELDTVQLRPGENRIRVQLANKWQKAELIDRLVSYLRPPVIAEWTATLVGQTPYARVEAKVKSPTKPTRIVLKVGDQEYELPKEAITRQGNGADWKLEVPSVSLSGEGKVPLKLVVWNVDGPSREAEEKVVQVPRPPLPRATVEITSALKVREPRYVLKWRVQSNGADNKLKRVEVKQGGRVIHKVDLQKQKLTDQDLWEVEDELAVTLKPGPDNLFLIEAENGGGLAEPKQVAIAYVLPPRRLVIDPIPSQQPGAALTVTGRASWETDAGREQVEAAIKGLRVYVNSFQQRRPVPKPGQGAQEVRFSVDVVLNQSKNDIKVECPGLPPEPDEQSLRSFSIDCARPQKPSLRVLIVNVGDKIDGVKLVQQARATLQAADSQGKGITSDVFEKISWDDASTGFVKADTVDRYLGRIEDQSSPTDVVLVYWLGKGPFDEGGDWYLPATATLKEKDRRQWIDTAVPLKHLLRIDADALGARILLLDVTSTEEAGDIQDPEEEQPGPDWWGSSRAAVLRYAWSQGEGPLPGLLKALEEAAQDSAKAEVCLRDVAQRAKELEKKNKAVFQPFNLSDLADLKLVSKQAPRIPAAQQPGP
jgi:WD40 repeat protein